MLLAQPSNPMQSPKRPLGLYSWEISMKHLAVLLVAALFSPVFAGPPENSATSKTPKNAKPKGRPTPPRPPAPGGTDYRTPLYIPTPGTQLSAPEYKSNPSTPSEPTPKAPKAPKVAPKKGKVKAPGGENQIGGLRPPPPPPPGGKAIVGPSDSSASKGSVKAPKGEKEAGYVKPKPHPPGGKAIVGPRDSATAKR